MEWRLFGITLTARSTIHLTVTASPHAERLAMRDTLLFFNQMARSWFAELFW